MPKAIIFDVDGTLVDSVKLHALAWQDAFRDFGRDHDLDSLHDQIGKGGDQLLPVFMTADEIAKDGKRLEDHRGKILTSKYLDKIVAFPDVRALFQRLLDDGKVAPA